MNKRKIIVKLKRTILFLGTYILTGICRFSILFISFKYLARVIGKEKGDYNADLVLDQREINRINAIKWSVCSASRRTPWRSLCMVKALTAMFMLKIYKIPSKLYLGLAKENDGTLSAHAWLQVANRIITGANEASNFIIVTWFIG